MPLSVAILPARRIQPPLPPRFRCKPRLQRSYARTGPGGPPGTKAEDVGDAPSACAPEARQEVAADACVSASIDKRGAPEQRRLVIQAFARS